MRIDALTSASASLPSPDAPGSDRSASLRSQDFAEVLRRGVSNLAEIQAAADQAAQSIAVGDLAQLHNAIIAMQKASLALEFVIAVRNHVVDGIQELLRTQV